MNHNQLKNKMDAIHNDFDKEALWNRIEADKKRKRPFLLWLALFFILAAIITFNIVINKDLKTNLTQVSDLTKELSIKGKEDKYTNEKVEETQSFTSLSEKSNEKSLEEYNNKQNSKIEKININNSSLKKVNETSRLKNVNNPTNTFSKIFYQAIEHNLLINSNPEIAQYNDAEKPNIENDVSPKNNILERDLALELPSTLNNEEIKSDKLESEINKENTFSKDENLQQISRLLTTEVSSNSEIEFPLELTLVSTSPRVKRKDNKVILSFGSGYDFHKFQIKDSTTNRQNLETNLESWSLNLHYERMFGRFSLEGGIGVTQGQTNIEKIERTDSWRFIDGKNSVLFWQGNEYNLFNQYQRLDVNMNVSYYFQLNKNWTLSPSLGLGYNLRSIAKGNYFDLSGKLQDLNNLNEYKSNSGIFAVYGLKSERKLSKDFTINFNIFRQSKRNLLSDSFMEYTHTINPIGLSIGVGKVF